MISAQNLRGDVTADSLSTATLEDHCVWTGTFDAGGTAGLVSMTLDGRSM